MIMKAGELRRKYPRFVYRGYEYRVRNGDLEMSFDFRLDEAGLHPAHIRFRPKVVVKHGATSNWLLTPANQPILENLVFHVGLAEMPSYWKATASPIIEVRAGYLSKVQLKWWHDLFLKGMGEYFYINKIDFTKPNFLEIVCTGKWHLKLPIVNKRSQRNNKILVPIGGGKDSIVTYEILKNAGEDVTPFVLNPTHAQQQVLKLMGQGSSAVVVRRTIDPTLLGLNRKGYLNGHTPFSAYLAFVTTLCGVLFDYRYIAVSNERSSNEGNVQYRGHEINHQYSKTFAFEKKFRAYSNTYLAQGVEYFSFLRPLYELQIAKLFSAYPKYFATFLSCNQAHATRSGTVQPAGAWCGVCSKCLFVYMILYPFIETKTLVKIFGAHLFEDKNLIPLMEELVGERKFKPFECVGTTTESRAALYLCVQKVEEPLPVMLRHFKARVIGKHPELSRQAQQLLTMWNKQHVVPAHLEQALVRVLQ
jgi:UDP-N-acetyl-alpha-D-muramoyl-L-alanyl-L-glutamate epimerase